MQKESQSGREAHAPRLTTKLSVKPDDVNPRSSESHLPFSTAAEALPLGGGSLPTEAQVKMRQELRKGSWQIATTTLIV